MLLLAVIFACSLSTNAQKFVQAYSGFSEKKVSHITMEDGSEMAVHLKNYKLEKGLIEEIKVENEAGKKVKIDPAKVKHMYIPPSALAKYGNLVAASSDLTKILDGELNQGYIQDGYVYMEKSNVKLKKGTDSYLMQLINPTFSGKLKVYTDPNAKETASIGVGGMTLAGGLDKSYYVKKATEDVAVKVTKKEYKEEFNRIFADCPELIQKYGADPGWDDFEKHVYEYSIAKAN